MFVPLLKATSSIDDRNGKKICGNDPSIDWEFAASDERKRTPPLCSAPGLLLADRFERNREDVALSFSPGGSCAPAYRRRFERRRAVAGRKNDDHDLWMPSGSLSAGMVSYVRGALDPVLCLGSIRPPQGGDTPALTGELFVAATGRMVTDDGGGAATGVSTKPVRSPSPPDEDKGLRGASSPGTAAAAALARARGAPGGPRRRRARGS
mmetsp:Transcript_17226/g.49955  ORF Transcript_17226/g.49955 Transcript_17226/m.49955 type:complete len:209 (+) Transcript_17226:698-1324(+)